jgi:hypothetical protein
MATGLAQAHKERHGKVEVTMAQTAAIPDAPEFEVHFRALFRQGFELVFPCDIDGHVDLDALSDRAKKNYLFARATVGHEYSMPELRRRIDTASR